MINVEKINFKGNHKICVISDIHHIKRLTKEFYESIVRIVIKEKLNYILIPGDIIDDPKLLLKELAMVKQLKFFIKNLSEICPVIISKGNHEIRHLNINIGLLYKELKFDNVYILDNKQIQIEDFNFLGFCPSNMGKERKKLIKKENFIKEYNACNFKILPDKINILLCHDPLIVAQVYQSLRGFSRLNYCISGHMHNGLVPKCLESFFKSHGFFGPHYTFFPKYCRGIHYLGNTKLVVCKSLRVLTRDNILFRNLDKLYNNTITFIKL